MKIAIHHNPGSFSDQWLEYCREHRIDTKQVDCLGSDIVAELADCDGLMWHWPHWDFRAVRIARQLTLALERMGKHVFPDSRTCWHYDDKIGQMYLLEAVGAPLVPSHVFYDKPAALAWIARTDFPKVFKLRRGAGSANVILVRSKSQAKSLVRRAFGNGFSPVNRIGLLRDRIWHLKRDRDLKALMGIGKGLARLVVPTELERNSSREKGYAYFQDFILGNSFDTRIIVIGSRAFGIKRMVREDDFRASGSGIIRYAKDEIEPGCVKMSFELSRKLGTQCLAYDYVFAGDRLQLLEISYAFTQGPYRKCPGYWDESLSWHEGAFIPEWFMVSDFVDSLDRKNGQTS
jgi:glutathione synthase/RimK-type ligase-like ATP-grasp enzyme